MYAGLGHRISKTAINLECAADLGSRLHLRSTQTKSTVQANRLRERAFVGEQRDGGTDPLTRTGKSHYFTYFVSFRINLEPPDRANRAHFSPDLRRKRDVFRGWVISGLSWTSGRRSGNYKVKFLRRRGEKVNRDVWKISALFNRI
mgnify:CR=1 FL=1